MRIRSLQMMKWGDLRFFRSILPKYLYFARLCRVGMDTPHRSKKSKRDHRLKSLKILQNNGFFHHSSYYLRLTVIPRHHPQHCPISSPSRHVLACLYRPRPSCPFHRISEHLEKIESKTHALLCPRTIQCNDRAGVHLVPDDRSLHGVSSKA